MQPFHLNGICIALEILANRRMHVEYNTPEWYILCSSLSHIAGIEFKRDPYHNNPYYQER